MDYRTVFDSAEAGYEWWWPAFGLVFVLLGFGLCRAAFRRGVETTRFSHGFAVFFFGFSLLWTSMAFFGTFTHWTIALTLHSAENRKS